MKRLTIPLGALSLLLAFGAAGLAAQQYAVELRGAGAAPTQQLAGADLNTGFGFGATVAVRVQPHVQLYGGWDWLHFRADESFAGGDRDFEETGYTFGVRFEHALREGSSLLYRLEGGGTYKHVEIEDEDGSLVGDSGHGLGFELGAGVAVPLNQSWWVSPMARYRSLSPEFTIGDATTKGDLRYASFELGFSYRF